MNVGPASSRLPTTVPSISATMEAGQVSPKSAAVPTIPVATIPIPLKSSHPVAGPSSEGAISGNNLSDASPSAVQPSSAPPTPNVISITHPSQFIHTHHPRRGSLTPLGLNVISPVPPNINGSPVRSVGFNPTFDATSQLRRDSVHSSSSILSASRPLQSLSPTSHRRSSLTPSISALAPPSPTKAFASGRLSRPNSSDGRDVRARVCTGGTSEARASPLGGGDHEGRRGSLPQLYGGSGSAPRWNPSLPTQRGSIDADVDQGFKFGEIPERPDSMLFASRRLSQMSQRKYEEMDAFEQAEQEEAERQRRAFIDATYGGDGRRARERLSIAGPGLPTSTGSPTGVTRRQSLMLWERLSLAPGGPLPPGGINPAAAVASGIDAGPSSAPPAFARSASSTSEDFGQRRGSLPIAIPGNGLNRTLSRSTRHQKDVDTQADEAEDAEDAEEGEEDPSSGLVRPLPPLLPLSDPGPRLLPSTLALQRASHLLTSRNLESAPLPAPLPPSLHPPAPVDLSEFDIDFILSGSKSQLGRERSKRASPNGGSSRQTPNLRGSEDEDTFAKFVGAFDDEYGDRRGEWTFRACPPRAADVFPFDAESGAPVVEVPKNSTTKLKAEWESPGAGRYQHYSTGEVHAERSGRVWKIRKMSSREYELQELDKQEPIVPFEKPSASSSAKVPASNTSNDDPLATVIASNGNIILTSKLAHTENGGVKLPLAVQREYSKKYRRANRLNLSASAPGVAEPHSQNGSVSDSLTDSTHTVRNGSVDSTATINPQTPQATANPRLSRPSYGSGLPSASYHVAAPSSYNSTASTGVTGVSLSTLPSSSTPSRDDSSGEERGRVQFAGDVHDSASSSSKKRDKSSTRSRSKDRSASGTSGSGAGAGEKDKKDKGLNVLKRGLFATIKDSKLIKDYEERKERREEKERERAQSQSWSGGSSASSHWSVVGSKTDYHHTTQHQPHKSVSAVAHHVGSPAQGAPVIPHGVNSRDHLPPPAPERSASTSASSHSGHSVPSSFSTSLAVNEEMVGGGATDDDGVFGSLGLGIEDEQNCGMPWKEGIAWSVVPDEAVAMVVPFERNVDENETSIAGRSGLGSSEDSTIDPARATSTLRPLSKISVNPFFTYGPSQALLVWFVPFNAEVEPSRTSLPRIDEQVATPPSGVPGGSGSSGEHSSSLGGRLPKILRRRASRDREGLRSKFNSNTVNSSSNVPEHLQPPDFDLTNQVCVTQPIPFKSFRIVAKVVNVQELRSVPEIPVIEFELWQEKRKVKGAIASGSGVDGLSVSPNHRTLSTSTSPSAASLPSSANSFSYSSLSPTPPPPQAGTIPAAPQPTLPRIQAGRAFPTVIGVCHSKNQGVEFVLEGLDRLGLCKGESAWGPTGYEEWRGTGLSEKGRELLDLLWAACAVVMGL